MHNNLNAVLASSRGRELHTIAHHPERLMARELELARARTSRWRLRGTPR
ncbi:hypothetical protein [Nocardioides sp. LHG3406-4]